MVQGSFLLDRSKVEGNPYYRLLSCLVDQPVVVEQIVVRKIDPCQTLHVRVIGREGRIAEAPITLFIQHPPIEELEKVAQLV